MGFIGLAEAIPFILIAIFAGHVADRINRKKLFFSALHFCYLLPGHFSIFLSIKFTLPHLEHFQFMELYFVLVLLVDFLPLLSLLTNHN